MARNPIFETLAALGAGAIMLSGCGGGNEAVKATEVPAAGSATPDATPAPSGEPATAPAADATPAPATSATPAAAAATSATPAAAAAPATMPMAKDMPKGNKTVKVRDSKRAKACQGGCGEGTCGGC